MQDLAKRLLEDRAKHIQRERERLRQLRSSRPIGADLDPYQVAKWRMVTAGDPGYLPKTPMRMGKAGFWIGCKGCGQKFESLGMAYCANCFELPAEERRALKPSGRACAAPDCGNVLAPTARVDAIYCSDACRKRTHRAISPDKNGVQGSDIPSPENVRDNAEKTQQDQGPKNDLQKSEAFARLQGDAQLSTWKPTAYGSADEMPDIPDFLRRAS